MLVVLVALLLAPELVPAGRHRQQEAGAGRRKRWERGTEAQRHTTHLQRSLTSAL